MSRPALSLPLRLLPLGLLLAASSFLGPLGIRAQAQDAAPKSLIPERSLDETRSATQFWLTGSDATGVTASPSGYGPIVDSRGKQLQRAFAPSLRLVDIDGDGLLDLLLCDAQSHLWLYYNKGSKTEAKFPVGVPLPVDLGGGPVAFDVASAEGGNLKNLFCGNGLGDFFRVRMLENGAVPRFETTKNLDAVCIPTSAVKGREMWCSYLAPALAAWVPGSEAGDLIIGDGTYASDNLYYLKNTGSAARPQFAERILVLPGEGREHLAPCAVDWNGDGKPDLLVGDREGHLLLYINDTPATGATQPKFKDPVFLKVGSSATGWGALSRVAAGDLDGNGKPVILVSSAIDGDNNRINPVRIARNTGTVAEPKFDSLVPLKVGTPGTAISEPVRWGFNYRNVPPATFFYVVQSVGADPAEKTTFEPDFAMPAGAKGKHALKFSFMPPPEGLTTDAYIFEDRARDEARNKMYHDFEENMYTWKVCYIPNGVGYGANDGDFLMLSPDVDYEFRFWAKGEKFDKITAGIMTREHSAEGYNRANLWVTRDVSPGSSWSEYRLPIRIRVDPDTEEGEAVRQHKPVTMQCRLQISFHGRGTFYLAEPSFVKK